MAKKLYLIPSMISEEGLSTLAPQIGEALSRIQYFLVENERSARRYIKKVRPELVISTLVFFELNEHTDLNAAKDFLLSSKGDVSVISEAGCPCVADPGSEIVLFAHEHRIEVVPLVGPSSILLALMASGLNGQNFAFVGYLPKDEGERRRQIKMLEKRSQLEQQTQIFMETPYRQEKVFEDILNVCQPTTLLSIAINVTDPKQTIKTQPISKWAKERPDFHKNPALFLVGSAAFLSGKGK